MAQTGYTPIQLYRTATASAAPTSGNLADGELAINTLDGKLFYKDSSGVVQTIATKGAGTIGGSTTQVQFNSSGALGGSASLTWDGTTLTSANSITSPVYKSATTLSLQTNGTTTAMTIDTSQNVGIGTSSPSTEGTNIKLAVVGTAGQQASSLATSNSNAGFSVRANSSSGYMLAIGATNNNSIPYIQGVNYNGGAASADLGIQAYGGNVGIGTISPSTKLSVVSSTTNAGISVNDGTVNTILYNSSSSYGSLGTTSNHAMAFLTNNTERMRIDTSGNVGIGTSSPGNRLHISGASNAVSGVSIQSTGASGRKYTIYSASTGGLYFSNDTGGGDQMVLDSSGNLLVGTATANAQFNVLSSSNVVSGRFQNAITSGTTVDILQTLANQAAGTGFYLARFYSAGTPQFAVRGDGTVYAQNTTIQSLSDERLKENITDSADGLDVILGLKTRRFDWKEGYGNNRKNQLGFIAQEVETVFPEAVDVWEEGENERTEYKSVGPSALIPVLVKAIQELSAKVTALESR